MYNFLLACPPKLSADHLQYEKLVLWFACKYSDVLYQTTYLLGNLKLARNGIDGHLRVIFCSDIGYSYIWKQVLIAFWIARVSALWLGWSASGFPTDYSFDNFTSVISIIILVLEWISWWSSKLWEREICWACYNLSNLCKPMDDKKISSGLLIKEC